jgi:GDP-L-fucose synthase
MINKNTKIYIAGHKGMVGSAIVRKLKDLKYKNLITVEKKNLDLRNQKKVLSFFKKKKPKIVIIASAVVGGILANSKNPARFIYDNMMIQNNIINSAYINGVKNLIFLGSSCIYPKYSKQPIKEEYLLSGKLEKSNEFYAIAKISGLKLCESYNCEYKTNFTCLMPPNLFGPNDNYDSENSHFIPALIKKIYEAKIKKKKKIILWGNGRSKREIMHVDDLADACIFFLQKKIQANIINVGVGKDYSIKQYAKMIMKIADYKVDIQYDFSKPTGVHRKLLDISRAAKYGWKPKTNIVRDLSKAYSNFIEEQIKN